MYGSTCIIYFKIYHYLKSHKVVKPCTKVEVLSNKQKSLMKKYIKQRYLNHKHFKINLSPIYE
jgi:hypothetical protein